MSRIKRYFSLSREIAPVNGRAEHRSQGIIMPSSRTNQASGKVFRSRSRHPADISITIRVIAMDRRRP